jgi:hypothetical protein
VDLAAATPTPNVAAELDNSSHTKRGGTMTYAEAQTAADAAGLDILDLLDLD